MCDSALQARESQHASERFANETRSHADKARNARAAITPPENMPRNTPENALLNNTYYTQR